MSTSVATPAVVSESKGEAKDSAVKVKKPRRVVDAASVRKSFDDLTKLLVDQIDLHRKNAEAAEAARKKEGKAGKAGNTGVKLLRTLNARVKAIRKDVDRMIAASSKKPRRPTRNDGGFCKAHPITKEMAAFAGWDPAIEKSRVDITKQICAYVKEQKLQNPANLKEIIPDEKLKALLKYDPAAPGNDPLTFFYLQKLIGQLQVKPASTKSASTASAPAASVSSK